MASAIKVATLPKSITLGEIMQAACGIPSKIAADKDFKLEKICKTCSDGFVRSDWQTSFMERLQPADYRSFWDTLDEELKKDHPEFASVISLFQKINEGLLALLLPQHTVLKQQISEHLDVDLIRQFAEKGVLDLKKYAHFIISTMAKLCASLWDHKIQELLATKETTPVYRGILEVLQLMRMDVANFTTQLVRPQNMEYEKKKFSELLKTVGGNKGLTSTREWLQRHKSVVDDAHSIESPDDRVTKILNSAYMELLDLNIDQDFPETLLMDRARFMELKSKIRKIDLLSDIFVRIVFICPKRLENSAEFKESLRERYSLLLEKGDKDLERALPLTAAQIVKDINEGLVKLKIPCLSAQQKKIVEGQISLVANTECGGRDIIHEQVVKFLREVLSSSSAAPQPVPRILSAMQYELAAVTGEFLGLVTRNRSMFGEIYAELIFKQCAPAPKDGSQVYLVQHKLGPSIS